MLAECLNKTPLQTLRLYEVSGDLGVELEVEGKNLPKELTGWDIKPENSLRGECAEYVTHGAVTHEQLEKSMKHLHKYLTREGTAVSYSNRESVHIHVNMQRETYHVIFGYILLFTILEPIFLRLMGEERNGNLFCLPAYETGDLPQFMTYVTKSLQKGVWSVPDRGKYANMNIDQLKSFGSIEVRCFPLSIQPDQVCQWASWLLNIKNVVREWPDKTYTTMFDYALDEPLDLIDKIFTGDLSPTLFSKMYPTNIAELVALGVETAYEVHRVMLELLDERKDNRHMRRKAAAVKKRNLGYTAEDFVDFNDYGSPPGLAAQVEEEEDL